MRRSNEHEAESGSGDSASNAGNAVPSLARDVCQTERA